MNGEPVGYAIFVQKYSVFSGCHTLWLDNLFVKPECRKHGIGTALMKYLGDVAVKRGYPRIEWWVLNWNEPAVTFYKKLNARPMSHWTVHRLSAEGLIDLRYSNFEK